MALPRDSTRLCCQRHLRAAVILLYFDDEGHERRLFMSGKKTQHITLLLDKCLVFSSVVCHAGAEKVNPLRRRAGWKEIKKASFKNKAFFFRSDQDLKLQNATSKKGRWRKKHKEAGRGKFGELKTRKTTKTKSSTNQRSTW